MLLQCLEYNYKCGNFAVLKYHYESFHKDKTDKCMCGNIILSGICDNDFSPWDCSLKNESSSNSSSNSNSISNSNSSSNPSSSSNPNSNSSSNPSSSSGSGSNPSSSSSSGSGSIYDYNSNSKFELIKIYFALINFFPSFYYRIFFCAIRDFLPMKRNKMKRDKVPCYKVFVTS